MYDLSDISKKLKSEADILLSQTDILDDLKTYGEVHLSGAYVGDVMMHGDIDITVVRDTPYSAEEVLDVLKVLYLKGKFRSYFIKGDWDDERMGNEFPHGHYIGMKQRLNGEKWKIDVWFVSIKEFDQRKDSFIDISSTLITDEQRVLILEIKKYRKDNALKISGQEIYVAVLKNGIKSVEEFIKMKNIFNGN